MSGNLIWPSEGTFDYKIFFLKPNGKNKTFACLPYWYCFWKPGKGVVLIKSDNNSKCCAECISVCFNISSSDIKTYNLVAISGGVMVPFPRLFLHSHSYASGFYTVMYGSLTNYLIQMAN